MGIRCAPGGHTTWGEFPHRELLSRARRGEVGGAWEEREGLTSSVEKNDSRRALHSPPEGPAVLHSGTHSRKEAPGGGLGVVPFSKSQRRSQPKGSTRLHPRPCNRMAGPLGRRNPRDLLRGPPPPPRPGPAPVTSHRPLIVGAFRLFPRSLIGSPGRQRSPRPATPPESWKTRLGAGSGSEGRGDRVPRG